MPELVLNIMPRKMSYAIVSLWNEKQASPYILRKLTYWYVFENHQ